MSKITALTANTSVAPGDLLVVVDVDDTTMAATGTDKKLTCTQLLSLPARSTAQPANPAATASTSLVMMGLGASCALTPASSGTVLAILTGEVFTNTALVVVTFGGRFGTGAAPANGAAASGTAFGSPANMTVQSSTLSAGIPFCIQSLITGLTAGTAYWFDLAASTANAADTADFYALSFTAVEVA